MSRDLCLENVRESEWYKEWLASLPSRESIKIKWWVVQDGQRYPNQNTFRGKWAYEATCACGWDSKTGGALRSSVKQDVENHKLYDHH